ncbi:MAG: hypothetical protein H7X97_01055 [Opitutaceae bacterium]|nr:hypothetical protein [Verrucomicrobiales bacterium]
MDDHFRAFSFVDRITAVQRGAPICGSYAIPANLADFPLSLVGEAVGQLAAWAAMAAVDFKCRPVAGIAGRIELLAPVRPGEIVELSVNIESVDEEAAGYGGSASVGGTPVIRLEHCVGPMVPVDQFDDPQALRDRFALLCGKGATPGAFSGLPPLSLLPADGENGQSKRATLQVPDFAPFFGDHFPRRPVFPGSLLMDCSLRLANCLASEIPQAVRGGTWRIHAVSDLKLRTFIAPGAVLELEARLQESSKNAAVLSVETRIKNRVVGGARVLLANEVPA